MLYIVIYTKALTVRFSGLRKLSPVSVQRWAQQQLLHCILTGARLVSLQQLPVSINNSHKFFNNFLSRHPDDMS